MRNRMKILAALGALCALLGLCACGARPAAEDAAGGTERIDSLGSSAELTKDAAGRTEITDSLGNSAYLTKDARVVSCYGSYAECWMLSGGALVGVTEDAVQERNLTLSEDVASVGTVKEINLEQLAALRPDYVILSADIAAHGVLEQSLKDMGIAYGYFREDSFADYAEMMRQFCAVNGGEECYEACVTRVAERIAKTRERIAGAPKKRVLLMRAFTGAVKAKTDDNVAGQILTEFPTENLAETYPSLLEDLSLEEIAKADPDYILVLTMGNEAVARETLKQQLEQHPLWQGLTAVQSGRYVILPKDLFHYKPNKRWDESYEYLAKILYPERF